VVHRHGGEVLVRGNGTGADAVLAGKLHLAEAFGGEPHHDARYAAVAHEQVGADADHGERHLFRQQLQEGDEIVEVVRMEHEFGEPAGLEPRNPVHRRIRRQTPAQLIDAVPERGQQLFSIDLFHFRPSEIASSSLGRAAASMMQSASLKQLAKSSKRLERRV